jgi:hypothetical protein
VDGRLVALEKPEDLAAFHHDRDVAVEQLLGGPRAWRLLPAPLDECVKPAEVVLGEAADDVFLGLEVVVERGLRDAEPLGDLAQRGPLVALLREKLERDLLDARPGVAAPPAVRLLVRVLRLAVRIAGLSRQLGLCRVHPRAVPPLTCGIIGRLTADRLRPAACSPLRNLLDGRLVRNIAFSLDLH